MKRCVSCGNKISKKDLFCNKCGSNDFVDTVTGTIKTIYLVIAGVFLFASFFIKPDITASMWDLIIFKVSTVVFVLFIFVLPGVIVKFDKLRKNIPLFKNKKIGQTIGGWVIFFLIAFIFTSAIEALHSSEYKLAYTEYTIKMEAKAVEDEKIAAEAKAAEEAKIIEEIKAAEDEKIAAEAKAAEEEAKIEAEAEALEEIKVAKTEEETITTENSSPEWLTASGNLYTGVELYIITDTTETLYGFVEEIDTTNGLVYVYMEAAGATECFERRAPLFFDVLKVRSDDPYLTINRK